MGAGRSLVAYGTRCSIQYWEERTSRRSPSFPSGQRHGCVNPMQTKKLALCAFSLHTLLACGATVSAPNDGSAATSDAGDGAATSNASSDAADSGAETSAPPQAIAIKFAFIKSGSSTDPKAWMNYGVNLDGLTTTKDSQDVCKRAAGAPSGNQEDGTGGIDNSWGRNVMPVFYNLDPTSATGYLVADATGTGKLLLQYKGALLEVPVVHAKMDTNGTTAKFSALVPVQAFGASFKSFAGRFSTSLCSGSAATSIVDQIAQAADILSTGLQSPSLTCDAISIGAELIDVASANPPIGTSPDPCGN